jgi:hypothetical protein
LDLEPADLLRGAPKAEMDADRAYINGFARLIRGKTARQKKALLDLLRTANTLAS